MANKFFKIPFSTDGDKTDVPNDAQADAKISYQTGWTAAYSQQDGGFPVAREAFNQLGEDITENLQYWQIYNYPQWIDPSQNDAMNYPYLKGTIVNYDTGSGPKPYQSLVNSNSAVPTDAANWFPMSEILDTAQWISGVTFKSTVVSGQFVAFNPTNSTYQQAVANGTQFANCVGVADVLNRRILTSGIWTGSTGLTSGAQYFLTADVGTEGQAFTAEPKNINNTVGVGYALSTSSFYVRIQKQRPTNPGRTYVTLPQGSTQTWGVTTAYNPQIPNFTNIVNDDYAIWDVDEKRFTISKEGLYAVTIRVNFSVFQGGSTNSEHSLMLLRDYEGYPPYSTNYASPSVFGAANFFANSPGTTAGSLTLSQIIFFNAGDQMTPVFFGVVTNSGSATITITANYGVTTTTNFPTIAQITKLF